VDAVTIATLPSNFPGAADAMPRNQAPLASNLPQLRNGRNALRRGSIYTTITAQQENWLLCILNACIIKGFGKDRLFLFTAKSKKVVV